MMLAPIFRRRTSCFFFKEKQNENEMVEEGLLQNKKKKNVSCVHKHIDDGFIILKQKRSTGFQSVEKTQLNNESAEALCTWALHIYI